MGDDGPYRVLARKYRPADFSDLIGQEALVRTVTNAIRTGRLAHAFLLTGVRGVGKTTTARILARAFNCIGTDGGGDGPTPDPCGQCEHCVAIAGDRHVDVLEMDAASRTGVDDIRELIDGVRYRPTSARYKVYIIDEVHMLSKQAFNALLKTLEEPPPHAKFIFATTEVRRLPVTVLSRCQRFDLRRVVGADLSAHFQKIAQRENARISEGAIRLIARAADGSVRDGLSLLDQAIVHGAGAVGEDEVRNMLGLADRSRVFELFAAVLRGEIATALDLLGEQYRAGADPIAVLEDMLELTHWLTRVKLVPAVAEEPGTAEIERKQGQEMAEKLAMPELTRAWQMLLKGLGDTRGAPNAMMAVEMALVRLAYAADLPTPAEAGRALGNAPGKATAVLPPPLPEQPATSLPPSLEQPAPDNGGGLALAEERTPEPDPQPEARSTETSKTESTVTKITCLADIVSLAEHHREVDLRHWLMSDVHLVRFSPGHIELRQNEIVLKPLATELSEKLRAWTGRQWMVALSDERGEPTLEEQAGEKIAAKLRAAEDDPLVRQVLKTFPDAEISGLRDDADSDDNS